VVAGEEEEGEVPARCVGSAPTCSDTRVRMAPALPAWSGNSDTVVVARYSSCAPSALYTARDVSPPARSGMLPPSSSYVSSFGTMMCERVTTRYLPPSPPADALVRACWLPAPPLPDELPAAAAGAAASVTCVVARMPKVTGTSPASSPASPTSASRLRWRVLLLVAGSASDAGVYAPTVAWWEVPLRNRSMLSICMASMVNRSRSPRSGLAGAGSPASVTGRESWHMADMASSAEW